MTRTILAGAGAAGATESREAEARRTLSVTAPRSSGEDVLVLLQPSARTAQKRISQAVRTGAFKGRDYRSSTGKTGGYLEEPSILARKAEIFCQR